MRSRDELLENTLKRQAVDEVTPEVYVRVRGSFLSHAEMRIPSMSLSCDMQADELRFHLGVNAQCSDFKWRSADVSGGFLGPRRKVEVSVR